MKKIVLSAFAIFALTLAANAQDSSFGVKAGADFATITVKVPYTDTEASASETGFFAGFYTDAAIAGNFGIHAEVLYVAIDDFNMISAPILARFTVAERFHLMAGPELNYLIDAEDNQLKVNFTAGAQYDITDEINVSGRYSAGFGDVKISGFFLGLGYTF